MKTFKVELTETVTYFTEIDADSIEEALAEGKRLAQGSDFPNGSVELLDSKVTAYNEDYTEKLETSW